MSLSLVYLHLCRKHKVWRGTLVRSLTITEYRESSLEHVAVTVHSWEQF